MPARWMLLCALEYEAKWLRRALPQDSVARICVIGPRATNLPATAELNGCQQILLAGLAGGLDPSLRAGDVVVDAEGEVPQGPWRRGRIYGSGAIVATPAAKKALFASTDALAVDMESDQVRQFARNLDARLIIVRAISDAADENLDPAMMSLIDSAGRLRPGRVARLLLRRPTGVVSMLRLQRRSGNAMRALAQAVKDLVQSGCSSPFPGIPGQGRGVG